ncbi:MAG: hypothetical protein K0B07_01865 [DPANN group archaeon]|nr:hypothetical protein [DPANN group archaeon]
MAGVIDSAEIQQYNAGLMGHLPVGSDYQYVLGPVYPVIRNAIEGRIQDFGTHTRFSNCCPDIMTVISHILKNDIGPTKAVHLFCKNPRPDDVWSNSIIENSEAELIYSDVMLPKNHDYMLSFVTDEDSNYLYSFDLDSNILELCMIQDSSNNISIPNLSSVNNLFKKFIEIDSCVICADFRGSGLDSDRVNEIRNSEMYLDIFNDITAKLNNYYKFLSGNSYPVEFRSIVGLTYGCDESGTYCDPSEYELSDTTARLVESKNGINMTLYCVRFDSRFDFPHVILSPKSSNSKLIPLANSSKEILDLLMPKPLLSGADLNG